MKININSIHDSDYMAFTRALEDLETKEQANELLEIVRSQDRNGLRKIKSAISFMDIKSQSRLKALFNL